MEVFLSQLKPDPTRMLDFTNLSSTPISPLFGLFSGSYQRSNWTSKSATFVLDSGLIIDPIHEIILLKLDLFTRFYRVQRSHKSPQIDPQNALFWLILSHRSGSKRLKVIFLLLGKGTIFPLKSALKHPLNTGSPSWGETALNGCLGSTIRHDINA